MKTLFTILLIITSFSFSYSQCVDYDATVTLISDCTETNNRIKTDGGTLTIDVGATLDCGSFNFIIRGPIIISGALIITGTLTIGKDGSVTVMNGGSIDAGYIRTGGDGSLTINNGGEVTATDFLNDFAGPASNNVTVEGSLVVSGTFTNNGDGVIAGSGELEATVVDNGSSTFDGTFTGDCSGTGTCGGSLPVKLIAFTSNIEDNQIQVEWTTSSELNNEFFTLYRSFDGYVFEEINTIEGAGTSNSEVSYKYIDDMVHTPSILYYKLRQTDFDGNSEEFPIIKLTSEAIVSHISVYPNPSTDIITFSEAININEISIHNTTGQSINEKFRVVSHTPLKLDISILEVGVYYIHTPTGTIKLEKH